MEMSLFPSLGRSLSAIARLASRLQLQVRGRTSVHFA
jgi:hypothetical protein